MHAFFLGSKLLPLLNSAYGPRFGLLTHSALLVLFAASVFGAAAPSGEAWAQTAVQNPVENPVQTETGNSWQFAEGEAAEGGQPFFGSLDAHVSLGTGSDIRPYEIHLLQNDPLKSLVSSSFFLTRWGLGVPLEFSAVTLRPQLDFEFRKFWKARVSTLNHEGTQKPKGFGFAAKPGLFLSGKTELAHWDVGFVYQFDRMNYNDASAVSSWQGIKILGGLQVGDEPTATTPSGSVFPIGHVQVAWVPPSARFSISRTDSLGKADNEQGPYAGFEFEFGMGVALAEAEGLIPDRLEFSYSRAQSTYSNLHVMRVGQTTNVRANSDALFLTLSYFTEPTSDLD